ncbi:CASP-like protein 1E1 [Panicum miliaceum]|uniref:CASP-like protein n=1 Tax=Panicum miliaceum TaxID=4540 RepID=A0A3L6R431_PANMI|nr:CASP-like protein 1E1 [Panicum miliaceum]
MCELLMRGDGSIAVSLSTPAIICVGMNKDGAWPHVVIILKEFLMSSLRVLIRRRARTSVEMACLALLEYFVVANAMVCLFSAAALAACRRRGAVVPVMVGDLLALALLFSAVGAAAEFGILGERGNSHVRWAKVCNVYGAFCERAMAAVIVSLLAAFANLVMLMLTILAIHKNSSYY